MAVTAFASEKHAHGFCDRCGFRARLKDLHTYTVKGKTINSRVCPSCWDADHPQLWVGSFPINDPQALRNPRPDNTYNDSRGEFAWNPVAIQQATFIVNSVTTTP